MDLCSRGARLEGKTTSMNKSKTKQLKTKQQKLSKGYLQNFVLRFWATGFSI